MDNVVKEAKRHLLNDPVVRIKNEIEARLQEDVLMSCDKATRIIEHILYHAIDEKEIKDYQIFAEINEVVVFVIENDYSETEIIKIPIKE
jgi:20S proteasome alpha/beta subunit